MIHGVHVRAAAMLRVTAEPIRGPARTTRPAASRRAVTIACTIPTATAGIGPTAIRAKFTATETIKTMRLRNTGAIHAIAADRG